MRVSDLQSIRIKLASPEDILSWSHGEVLKPETINYRTQKPEKDGLFCEKIFGPTKDYQCYCGKYKGIRYKGVVCDRCGVEVTKSSVRRKRMGHITLAVPCSHIWFLRGVPSRMGMVLNISSQQLERVIYYSAYIVTNVDKEAKKGLLESLNKEYKTKISNLKNNKKIKDAKKGAIEENLAKLKSTYDKIKMEISEIRPLRILSEAEYRDLSLKYGEVFEAGTGSEVLRKIFEKINLSEEISKLRASLQKKNTPVERRKILRRLNFFRGMKKAKVRPEWMFFKVLPVLPPELRPMVQLDGGRYASSDLNDLYRRVINRNNRLKYLLSLQAPEVIVRNEKRMLQEAVDALLDNSMRKGQTTVATTGGRRLLKSLADILKGKQGRFRRNLLGKRVDYSGRSVIAVGPELKLYQCGIPKIMALELFKPFVIKKLLDKELAYNIRGATRLIEEGTPEVFESLEEVVKDKLVLLNRAPTLHRLSIQAFQPVLIEGEAIRLHPLVCKAFNADFDGDQMAVHLPLSSKAQGEARDIMLSSHNLLKPANGLPVVSPTKDIVYGCYWLTGIEKGALGEGRVFSSFREVILAQGLNKVDLRAQIKVFYPKLNKIIETTCGRIIFNDILPQDYPFFNKQLTSKALSGIVADLIRNYPEDKVRIVLDDIKELGFEYSTLSGISWGMDDLITPPEKKELLSEAQKEVDIIEEQYKKGLLSAGERAAKIIFIWQGIKEKVGELVSKTLPQNGPVFLMVDSGARGSWTQPVQMAGMKGLVIDPSGRTIELPIRHSFKEGFDILEYFISTHGGRKGTADTALRTSASGYLTRRLVDVSHEVIVREEDCGDTKGIVIHRDDADEIGQDFSLKIVGRVVLEDVTDPKTKKIIVKKGEIIDWQASEAIKKSKVKSVRVRSPLTCKAKRGVCQKCYGWQLARNSLVELGEAVGIIAAQSIGEPGTQLTLRTFHSGGVAGGGDITQGLPRVEEIVELRDPKGEAVIALKKGQVKEIDFENRIVKIESEDSQKSKKKEMLEYHIPPATAFLVKVGDMVEKGQGLCEGSINLRKLFRLRGKEAVQKYILKEIQRIYASEGVGIHDKHIEVIVRQMFSRVRITQQGDSIWMPGEIVSKDAFEEEKQRLKGQSKEIPKASQAFLGISKVALTSDSFLSAASFQETSRILIKACLEGQEDHLWGLKENVMIGRLIPAGTGFRK
ncbi:DNA-directed RNA polymerase subunit beta' [bacterium]|nr:DNA-directed RNA polymerase subunit beta' [bacterium]